MAKVSLGIRQNWKQFTILVIVNAFVGGMIGLERSILPTYVASKFGLNAQVYIFSFVMVFGIAKAISNYFMGRLANQFGRKKLLVFGWILALPVPLLFMFASSWTWILGANILLGIHQGLCWSTTVVMKIDLVGSRNRGLAMGLNEFAGYISVALMAYFTGKIVEVYGPYPYPFYLGIGLAVTGLFLSIFFVKDTQVFVNKELTTDRTPALKNIFWQTTINHPNLGAVSQAGLVNNLNDALVWIVLPLLLAQKSYPIEKIGLICAIYPAIWGITQIFTGKLGDIFCKKNMLFYGMLSQGIALLALSFAETFFQFTLVSIVLGIGTALVYPTFLATISENTNPTDRAEAMGVFRFWRDLGYAVGAIITVLFASKLGYSQSIIAVSLITILSAIIIKYRMYCFAQMQDKQQTITLL